MNARRYGSMCLFVAVGCTGADEAPPPPVPMTEEQTVAVAPSPRADRCAGRSPLYASAFGSDSDDFLPVAGAFTTDGHALRIAERDEGALAWPGPRSWQDYTVEGRIRLDHPAGDAGIAFRVTEVSATNNGGAHYYVGLYPATDELQLGIMYRGTWRPIAAAPADVDVDRWYSLRVELDGGHIRVHLDGRPVFEIDDATLDRGGVAVRGYRALASYQSIVVC